MAQSNTRSGAAETEETPAKSREIKYEFTPNFPEILSQLGITLLVSTYQAGQLVKLGAPGGKLEISFHRFDRCMGIAWQSGRLAVGSRESVHFLEERREVASALPTPGFETTYLARRSIQTGEIQGHELVWSDSKLWCVNTAFSCLCQISDTFSFLPIWKPKFISELAAEDRCHLNGVAFDGGSPAYVSVLGETNTPQGWRPGKLGGGCLMDVRQNEVVARGFAMPHSPRVWNNQLWCLNSGYGRLEMIDRHSGKATEVVGVPGYTRGLAFAGPIAAIGMSKIRETSTFGGMPIAETKDELRCAIALVNWQTGQAISRIEFKTGVEEIFDVQIMPGVRSAYISGPNSHDDEQAPVWVVPPMQ
jgi:uncharacterized protein (TIGR03032 family)